MLKVLRAAIIYTISFASSHDDDESFEDVSNVRRNAHLVLI